MTTDAIRIISEEHAAVAAMLRSLVMMVDRGPGDHRDRFFDVVRAMLFYIDEFPERRHHPNESRYLFPVLARCAPELGSVIERLERDHASGERLVRELQHLLTAWQIMGDVRRRPFADALEPYVRFYLEHMRTEETELLPVARRVLPEAERRALDKAFLEARDPLAGGPRDPEYDALFTRIVQKVPAPIGVGDA